MERGGDRNRAGEAGPRQLGGGAPMSAQINRPRFAHSLEAAEHPCYQDIRTCFSSLFLPLPEQSTEGLLFPQKQTFLSITLQPQQVPGHPLQARAALRWAFSAPAGDLQFPLGKPLPPCPQTASLPATLIPWVPMPLSNRLYRICIACTDLPSGVPSHAARLRLHLGV